MDILPNEIQSLIYTNYTHRCWSNFRSRIDLEELQFYFSSHHYLVRKMYREIFLQMSHNLWKYGNSSWFDWDSNALKNLVPEAIDPMSKCDDPFTIRDLEFEYWFVKNFIAIESPQIGVNLRSCADILFHFLTQSNLFHFSYDSYIKFEYFKKYYRKYRNKNGFSKESFFRSRYYSVFTYLGISLCEARSILYMRGVRVNTSLECTKKMVQQKKIEKFKKIKN